MNTFEERGRKFARSSDLLAALVDDALAGIDMERVDVTESRLKELWKALQAIQATNGPNRPNSNYIREIRGTVI